MPGPRGAAECQSPIRSVNVFRKVPRVLKRANVAEDRCHLGYIRRRLALSLLKVHVQPPMQPDVGLVQHRLLDQYQCALAAFCPLGHEHYKHCRFGHQPLFSARRTNEAVRILDVDTVPYPDDDVLKPFLNRLGFRAEDIYGTTSGHGIYRWLPSFVGDIRAHEFRHVAQFECLGSIRSYAFLHFPAGAGPLEIMPSRAAKIALAQE